MSTAIVSRRTQAERMLRRLLVGPGAAKAREQQGHRLFRRPPRQQSGDVLHATNDVAVLLGLLTADDAADA